MLLLSQLKLERFGSFAVSGASLPVKGGQMGSQISGQIGGQMSSSMVTQWVAQWVAQSI